MVRWTDPVTPSTTSWGEGRDPTLGWNGPRPTTWVTRGGIVPIPLLLKCYWTPILLGVQWCLGLQIQDVALKWPPSWSTTSWDEGRDQTLQWNGPLLLLGWVEVECPLYYSSSNYTEPLSFWAQVLLTIANTCISLKRSCIHPHWITPQNWTQEGKLSASTFKRNLHSQQAYWFWECRS